MWAFIETTPQSGYGRLALTLNGRLAPVAASYFKLMLSMTSLSLRP